MNWFGCLALVPGVLLWQGVVSACPVCRPGVNAGVYDANFGANMLLMLLPIAILCVIGATLYYVDEIGARLRPVSRPIGANDVG